MPKFKTGDVVRLKSGGPEMTVQNYVPGKTRVICTWFDDKGKHSDGFEEDQLEREEDEGGLG